MQLVGMKEKSSLKEVASLFLKPGVIGFGGPVAHITMMKNMVVTKRKWISEQP